MFFSISFAARIIGVSISTLRRWDSNGSFIPDFRTVGGHRRYSTETIHELTQCPPLEKPESKFVVLYSRVSGNDQKEDLKRQSQRLATYAAQQGFTNAMSISDLGSGLKYTKPGLTKLIKLIMQDRVDKLILVHKDRLLRFGSEIIFQICKWKDIEVIILEEQLQASFEQELVADIICIMTVFTAKLYGKRAHKSQKRMQKSDKKKKPLTALGVCYG